MRLRADPGAVLEVQDMPICRLVRSQVRLRAGPVIGKHSHSFQFVGKAPYPVVLRGIVAPDRATLVPQTP